jgi:hypothetical protein
MQPSGSEVSFHPAAFILHPFLRAPISPRLTNRQGERSRSRPYSGLDFQELDLSRFSPAQSGNAGEFLSLDYSLRFPLLVRRLVEAASELGKEWK